LNGATGILFYRIQSGGWSATKKMMRTDWSKHSSAQKIRQRWSVAWFFLYEMSESFRVTSRFGGSDNFEWQDNALLTEAWWAILAGGGLKKVSCCPSRSVGHPGCHPRLYKKDLKLIVGPPRRNKRILMDKIHIINILQIIFLYTIQKLYF
jgi:hypothetical protein